MSAVAVAKKRFDEFLPIELRLKIWKQAAFVPRNVDIWIKNIYATKDEHPEAYLIPYRIFSRSPPPAILHVCRESREEGLKHYTLELGTRKEQGCFIVTTKPKIYLNPAVDTVCLPRPETFLGYMTSQGSDYFDSRQLEFAAQVARMKLRSLAINVSRREKLAIRNDTEASVYGGILPTTGDALEELILFSDPRYYNFLRTSGDAPEDLVIFSDPKYYNYGDEGNETRDHYDVVSFQTLPEDEENGLIEDLGLLDCYYLPASDCCGPEGTARYNSWKKVLCKVDGRFEEVEG